MTTRTYVAKRTGRRNKPVDLHLTCGLVRLRPTGVHLLELTEEEARAVAALPNVRLTPSRAEVRTAPPPPPTADLSKMRVAELRALAEERGVDHEGLRKAELVEALGG